MILLIIGILGSFEANLHFHLTHKAQMVSKSLLPTDYKKRGIQEITKNISYIALTSLYCNNACRSFNNTHAMLNIALRHVIYLPPNIAPFSFSKWLTLGKPLLYPFVFLVTMHLLLANHSPKMVPTKHCWIINSFSRFHSENRICYQTHMFFFTKMKFFHNNKVQGYQQNPKII